MSEIYIDFEGLKNALINQEKPLGAIWDAFHWGQYTRIESLSELVQEHQRAKNGPDKYPQGLHLCEEALQINHALKGFFVCRSYADDQRTDAKPPTEVVGPAMPATRPPPFRSMSSMMANPASSPIIQPGRLTSSHRVVDVDFQLNLLPKIDVIFSEPPGDDEDDSLVVTSPAAFDTASRTTWANGPNQSNHPAGFVDARAPRVPGKYGNSTYLDGSSVHINMHCGIIALVSKAIDAERYKYLVLENFHYGIVDDVIKPLLDDSIIGILGASPSTLEAPHGLDYDDNKTIIEGMYSGHKRMIEEPSFTVSLGKGNVDGWLWCGPGPHPSLKNKQKTAFFQSAISRSGRPFGYWTAPLFKLEFVGSKDMPDVSIDIPYTVVLDTGSALNSFLPSETDEIFSRCVKVHDITVANSTTTERGLSLKQDYLFVRLHFKDSTALRPGALPRHWYIEAPISVFFGYNKEFDDQAYNAMLLTFNEHSHAHLISLGSEPFGLLGAPFFSMVAVEFRALKGKSAVCFRARDVATKDPSKYPNGRSFVHMVDLTDKT